MRRIELGASEEPFSRSALWSRRLGVFAVPVAALAVLVIRSGRIDPASGLAGLGSGLVLALLAAVLGIAALSNIWVTGRQGASAAAVGLLCGILVLAVPSAYLAVGLGLPAISDVTTDPADPPAFVFAATERRQADNRLAHGGDRDAIAQMAGYPDIMPLQLGVPADEAHGLALELVRARGWRVLDPGTSGTSPRRRIEAVARTRILGLSEDVVIRIRPEGAASRVDMRSASRLGRHDLGENARRIRAFLTDLAAAAR